jgi:NADPH2:quinone reductase
MEAVELTAFVGLSGLRVVHLPIPKPGPQEVLIEVKAAGVNFAELELLNGRYPAGKQPPFIMGFEAAGVVVEVGSEVLETRVGDRVAAIVASGGYAQYATAEAAACIPIPDGLSYMEATTIPIQGLSAYALLEYAAKPQPAESVIVQAAAGGVGLYLVQLLRLRGIKKLVSLAGSEEKIRFLEGLDAGQILNYSTGDWPDRVRATLGAEGADVVLEAASGEVGRESFKLVAPFGRMIMFGARNIHDTLSPAQVRQLITRNQQVIGFNFPSLGWDRVRACVPRLLELISTRRLKLFAHTSYSLSEVTGAFEALSSRQTIGKVVLIP